MIFYKYLNEQKNIKKDVDYLVDIFTSAYSYIKFRTFMEGIEKQANEGDRSAKELIKMVSRFKKLVEISQK